MPIITWSYERQGGSHSLHSSGPLLLPFFSNQHKNNKIKILSHYSALGLYLPSSFNLAASLPVLSSAATTPKTKKIKKNGYAFSFSQAEHNFSNDYYCQGLVFQCSLLPGLLQSVHFISAGNERVWVNLQGVCSLYTTQPQSNAKMAFGSTKIFSVLVFVRKKISTRKKIKF